MLRDPNFFRSVVVLVEHGAEGSFGFVVNRPAAVSFGQVAALLGLEPRANAARTPVFHGGPVAPQSGWILFDPRGADSALLEDAVTVAGELAVSASRRLLETIARGEGPERSLLALGYAGWAAGQLDGEFARGVWIPVDLDDEIVFDVAPRDRWHAALTSAGIDPARMSPTGAFSA
ncbi:MAG TPA: YqgE/AlgH family protein [Sandaracinaceae bacterium]